MSSKEPQYDTQLSQMLGVARKTPAPPELGTATQLGDPRKIAPAAFPSAQSAAVQWYLLDQGVGGEYVPETNTIRISSIYKLINDFKDIADVQWQSGTYHEKAQAPSYVPGILPHEVGHAVMNEFMHRIRDPDSKKAQAALDTVHEWQALHDTYLSKNKALGRYQYADDSLHSFADAFGAWHVDQAKFKNLFPELSAYFEKISKVDQPESKK